MVNGGLLLPRGRLVRMWLQLAVVVLGVGLVGCNLDPAKSCQRDDDCSGGGRCDTGTKTCVTTQCKQACGFGEYCEEASAVCAVAHTGSEVTSPVAGKVGARVKVHVKLTPAQTAPHEDPSTLMATVISEEGGSESVALDKVEGVDGEYEGTWSPGASGEYEVKVEDESYPSAGVKVSADREGPKFWVEVVPHEARPDVGPTKYADVGMPGAYRRDEVVKVEVKSNDEDVDPGSVRVAVTGTGAAWDAGEMAPVTSECDATYCGEVEVPLWGPEMKAYHARFEVAASGMDDGGNEGELVDGGSVEVTRYKWTFTAPDGFHIVASPAVGRDGTVYVGTADPSTTAKGTLYAVRPDGTKRWEMDAGAVELSPAVGADAGGFEHVFVAGAYDTSLGNMWALDSRDGSVSNSCDGTPRGTSGLAISSTSIAGVESETATMGGADKTLTAFRVAVSGTTNRCLATTPFSAAPSGNVVTSSNHFFAPGGGTAAIEAAEFLSSGWQLDGVLATSAVPSTLALSEARFLFSATPGVSAIDENGSNQVSFSAGGDVTSGPLIGSASGYVGAVSNLVRVDLDELTSSTVHPAGAGAKASGVLGEGNRLYLSAGTGFQAWKQDGGTFEWEASDAGIGAADIGLSIDCTRDDAGTPLARPGVVYVKSGSTSLSAIIVDSHGIDTSAPWPKYQHDPRNTGNVDTPMTDFACP